ncbi:hypothetical protein C8T65DRAFT_84005 [Cerioporus squamosus]|nr:hypothetical protein C8T65DRAFT_84005 [Cerioporus squamosus]
MVQGLQAIRHDCVRAPACGTRSTRAETNHRGRLPDPHHLLPPTSAARYFGLHTHQPLPHPPTPSKTVMKAYYGCDDIHLPSSSKTSSPPLSLYIDPSLLLMPWERVEVNALSTDDDFQEDDSKSEDDDSDESADESDADFTPRKFKKPRSHLGKSTPRFLSESASPSPSSPAPSAGTSRSTSSRKVRLADHIVRTMIVAPRYKTPCGVRGCAYIYDVKKLRENREHFLGHFGWRRVRGKGWTKVEQSSTIETSPHPSTSRTQEATSQDGPTHPVAGQKRKRGGPKRTTVQVPCRWKGCTEMISDGSWGITRHLDQDHLEIRYRCIKGCRADKTYTRVDKADKHEDHKCDAVSRSLSEPLRAVGV